MEQLEKQAESIWWAAVQAVDPERLVSRQVRLRGEELRVGGHAITLGDGANVIVVGAGKASGRMAAALERRLSRLVRGGRLRGLVNVPADQVRPLRAIRLHAARHTAENEPTEAGVEGAREIERLLAGAGPQDVAICLISGGGSALLPAPVEGVSLEDKRRLTRLLLEAGATINEINCVRKHLSRLKGGGIVRLFPGRALFSLILSDVVGDPLDVIASGPTAPDPTTFADAVAVLKRYGLWDRAPMSVRAYLERGLRGEVPETLKKLPRNVYNLIVGNNRTALNAAARAARRGGFRVVDLGSFIQGETRHVATAMAGIVRSIVRDARPAPPPVCLLSGGETTVSLPEEHGKGGRNQEFAVAFGQALDVGSLSDVVCLSAGTDGEDGPTDAAGGIVSRRLFRRAERLSLKPREYLDRHDCYTFLGQIGGLFRTGPTGTNVTDIRVILVGTRARADGASR